MNKKLLKSIVCIAAGVGIATSIPFATTSCGSSSSEEKINPLPEEVYEINSENVLIGFKDAFLNDSASDIYKDKFKDDCDTIQIPVEVTSIGEYAFQEKVPPFIHKLVFPKNSKCAIINDSAFNNCSSLTSITFPNSLTSICGNAFYNCNALTSIDLSHTNLSSFKRGYAFSNCLGLTSVTLPRSLNYTSDFIFYQCTNLKNITWNAWEGPSSDIWYNSFSSISEKGKIKVINPINEAHNSAALLEFLKTKGGLPSGWNI